MVEFCKSCGVSMPLGDLTIKEGNVFTSPDYHCPICGKLAAPAGVVAELPEVPDNGDMVVKDGVVTIDGEGSKPEPLAEEGEEQPAETPEPPA